MKPISGKLKTLESEIVASYKTGLSLIAVGKRFCVTGRAVWECLKRQGVARRPTTGRFVKYCKRGHDRTDPENQYVDISGKIACLTCRNLRNKDPQVVENKKRHNLKTNYGITLEEKETKRIAQDNKCKICGAQFIKSPHTDHDHDTGQIRDLLCGKCNVGLGNFLHSPELLDVAATYLRRWKAIQDAITKGRIVERIT